MKNRIITSIGLIIYGAILAIGPLTIFKGCPKGGHIMKCHHSIDILLILGIITGVIGIVSFIIKSDKIRLITSIIGLLSTIIAVLIPSVLIGACKNEMMDCRKITFPVVYVISAIFGVVFLINSIYIITKIKKNRLHLKREDSSL